MVKNFSDERQVLWLFLAPNSSNSRTVIFDNGKYCNLKYFYMKTIDTYFVEKCK